MALPPKGSKPAAKSASQLRAEKLAALRSKLNTNTDLGGGGQGFWSPPEGKSIIRILPEIGEELGGGMSFFFQEVGRHFINEGKKSFYCPSFTTSKEKPCPICETVYDLYKGDAAAKAMAGELRVRRAYWMNVIVRGHEDAGPQIYTPGVTVFQAIISLVNDPDYGDIFDIWEGHDITIERSGKGLETEYQVVPKPKATPLSADENKIQEWIDAAKDLSWVELSDDPAEDKELSKDHAVYLMPYDRLAAEFDGAQNIDDDEDEPQEPAQRAKAAVTASRAPATKPVARRAPVAPAAVEEEDDSIPFEPDAATDDDDAEEEQPVRQEINRRQARRSIRR